MTEELEILQQTLQDEIKLNISLKNRLRLVEDIIKEAENIKPLPGNLFLAIKQYRDYKDDEYDCSDGFDLD